MINVLQLCIEGLRSKRKRDQPMNEAMEGCVIVRGGPEGRPINCDVRVGILPLNIEFMPIIHYGDINVEEVHRLPTKLCCKFNCRKHAI